jgi:polyvinyl alcohol dehydrogenase (cytochrome)
LNDADAHWQRRTVDVEMAHRCQDESMTLTRFALPALALIGAATLALAAPPDRSADPLAPPPVDSATGARTYQVRCAGCHDHPTGRIPPRSEIENNTRPYIVSVLAEGIMKPMAKDMSWTDIGAVAAYLAKRQSGISTTGLEAPRCTSKPPPFDLNGDTWNGWGAGISNARFQPNPGLGAADVPRLKVKWAFGHAGGRNGQATIVAGRVFTNSSSGAIYALDAKTGCAFWRFDADAGSRTSIVIGALPPVKKTRHRYAAYFADQSRHVYAIDAVTGALLWKSDVDNQVGVQMTGSLTLYKDRLYVPVSSAEEAMAVNDSYECCKFRGALVALDAFTGKVLWKTYTTPEEPKPFRKNAKGTQMYGPAGGAIWSAPTIDAKRNLVYVATGDSYTDVPYSGADAIMALDMNSGAVRWVNQLNAEDSYIIGCYGQRSVANCPSKVGPDADFGASPILHTLADGRQIILAGQKSSQIYALDPDNKGAILWQQRLSPGGPLGGVEFGPASDRDNLYVALADIFIGPAGKPGLSAIRISDGKILWTTPGASPVVCPWKNEWCHAALSQAVTVIPGVVFAGSMDGHFRAYDTQTGKVLWDDDTAVVHHTVSDRDANGGGLDGAGPTVAGGMVYVTSGYQGRSRTSGSVLLAYSVDGK